MTYQVLARKWRPQTFDELVGQDAVSVTLRNALRSGRIAHAFLFSGVRGVGKTTVARILAKALNCHREITEDPCGECPSCLEIREGNSVDVQEIDAASNRGIDSIRELRENVRYGTARDRFKIFIVDEVHMLTTEAFNALLKTLEEPPSHVKFILATTELHKIPTTIASRCQKYEFKPIGFKQIHERLRLICDAEGVEMSDFALGLVSTAAQGSLRDGQSALDLLIAFGGNRIQDGDVKALLGVIDQGVVADLVDHVQRRDRSALINGILEVSSSGISAQMICSKLIERVRSLLVYRAVGWNEVILQLPDSQKESVARQSELFSELDLIRFYDILNRTSSELKWHSQPDVHLEISLLKLIEVAQLSSIEEVIRELRSGGRDLVAASTGGSPEPERTPAAPVEVQQKVPIGFARESKAGEVSSEEDRLRIFLDTVQNRFQGLYFQLQSASEIVYSEGRLRIRFPDSEGIHADSVRSAQNKLSATFASITGSEPQVEVVVDQPSAEREKSISPTEDPRVRAFIQRFPGKMLVRKESDE